MTHRSVLQLKYHYYHVYAIRCSKHWKCFVAMDARLARIVPLSSILLRVSAISELFFVRDSSAAWHQAVFNTRSSVPTARFDLQAPVTNLVACHPRGHSADHLGDRSPKSPLFTVAWRGGSQCMLFIIYGERWSAVCAGHPKLEGLEDQSGSGCRCHIKSPPAPKLWGTQSLAVWNCWRLRRDALNRTTSAASLRTRCTATTSPALGFHLCIAHVSLALPR